MLDLTVTLVISENQNPINITLSSVTIDTAESMEDLGAFIDFYVPPGYRARTGIYALYYSYIATPSSHYLSVYLLRTEGFIHSCPPAIYIYF